MVLFQRLFAAPGGRLDLADEPLGAHKDGADAQPDGTGPGLFALRLDENRAVVTRVEWWDNRDSTKGVFNTWITRAPDDPEGLW